MGNYFHFQEERKKMYFILIDEFGNLLIYAAEFNNNILCVDFLKKNSPPSPEISESAFDKKEKKIFPQNLLKVYIMAT